MGAIGLIAVVSLIWIAVGAILYTRVKRKQSEKWEDAIRQAVAESIVKQNVRYDELWLKWREAQYRADSHWCRIDDSHQRVKVTGKLLKKGEWPEQQFDHERYEAINLRTMKKLMVFSVPSKPIDDVYDARMEGLRRIAKEFGLNENEVTWDYAPQLERKG